MSAEEQKKIDPNPADDTSGNASTDGGEDPSKEIISFEATSPEHTHTPDSKDLKEPKELQENLALGKIITALGAALAETDPAAMKSKIQAVLNSLKSMGGKKAEAVEDNEAVKKVKAEAEAKERELSDRIALLEKAKNEATVEKATDKLLRDGCIAPVQAAQVKKIFSMNPLLIDEMSGIFEKQKLSIPIGKEKGQQITTKEGKKDFTKEELARINDEHGINQLLKEKGA